MARSPSRTPFRPPWATGHEAVPRLPNPATSINITFGCSMPRKAPSPYCLGFAFTYRCRYSVSIEGSSTRQHGGVPATFSRLDTLESGDEVVSDEEEPSVAQAPVTGIRDSALSPGYFEKYPLPSAKTVRADVGDRFFVAEKELGRGGKGVVLLVRHVLDGVFLGEFACKRVPVGELVYWFTAPRTPDTDSGQETTMTGLQRC